MEISNNYSSNSVSLNNNKKIYFKSNESEHQAQKWTGLSNVTTPQNIRTPISYIFIKDIKLPNNLTAKYYKLANGQKVVICPKKGETIVKSYVNTGSFNEPDNVRGISHYIEHNLFNGSEDLGDKVFFKEVDNLGAETNASTNYAVTDYYIASQLLEDTDLEEEIKLHAGMLQSPKFLLEKLKKEKDIVNSEINMYMADDVGTGINQTIKNLFNVKSTSKDLIAGTTDNIDNLTREDVVKYFNANYYPANITTVITGDVNPEETINLISKYFNSTKMPQGQRSYEKLTPIDKPVRQDIIGQKTDKDSTNIILGFSGPKNNSIEDSVYYTAMRALLTTLNNSRARNLEQKYGESLHISQEKISSEPNSPTFLSLHASVPENLSEQYIKDVYQIISDLQTDPPTEDELQAVKFRLKKAFNSTFENSNDINFAIAEAFLNNELAPITQFNQIIDNMTAEDLVNFAKKYLDLNKVALTVVHPNTTTESAINNNYKEINKVSNVAFTGKRDIVPENLKDVETYHFSNNFDLILNNTNSDNIEYTVDIATHDYNPHKAATADILAELLNSGTSNIDLNGENKFKDKYGISHSTVAGDEFISLDGAFPLESTQNALGYIREKLYSPNFSQIEFDKAVNNLRNMYAGYETSPWNLFTKESLSNTSFAINDKDRLDSLNSITLQDVVDLYNEILNKGEGHVVITAPIQAHPELKQEIFNQVATYKNVKPINRELKQTYKPIDKTKVLTAPNKRNQADVVATYKFQRNGNIKDNICVDMLNSILGGSTNSRLFNDLRETRHLAYGVGSNVRKIGNTGLLNLTIGTTTENMETGQKTYDNIKKSIVGFDDNIRKITTEKVSEKELDNAKKAMKKEILDACDTSHKNYLLENDFHTKYGLNYTNEAFKVIDSITVDDIYNAANNIFKSKPMYSITATQESLNANQDYFKELENKNNN